MIEINRNLAFGIFMAFLLLLASIGVASSTYVSGDYSTIQWTIDNASAGDTKKWIPFIPRAIPGAPHEVKPKSSDNEGIAVYCSVPGMYVVDIPVDGDVYQRLIIPYAGHTAEVGKPELPVIIRYLEVPRNVDVKVKILYSKYKMLEGFKIYPVQKPLPGTETGETYDFVIDKDTYSTDAFYPSDVAMVGEPGIMRGHRIIPLILYPIQYNPAKKQLRVYPEIEVKVIYSEPAQIEGIEERLESDAFEALCKAFILNYKPPEEYPTRYSSTSSAHQLKSSSSSGADYLIITNISFVNALEPFADWKEKKGLKTKIVTTRQISPDGVTAEDIRKYLKNAYDTWNPPPTYVLLVGDSEIIPTNYGLPHPSHGLTPTATDLYYGTLDGDDHYPDVFVGRISVDTKEQAETIVDKILNYERNPPSHGSFYKNVSVIAFFQDDDPFTPVVESDGYEDRRFVLTSEEIRDYLLTQGYNVERIYTTNSAVTPTNYNLGAYDAGDPLPPDLQPPFPWDGDTQDIIDAFNDGRFIINYRDHGAVTGWGHPRFFTIHFAQLANGDLLPVVFSIACQTGWFDTETDEYPDNNNTESFCEELLRYDNGGAVAVIGATRTSYSGLNDDLCKGFYDAMWPDFDPAMTTGPIFELGQIHTYGKVYMTVMRGTTYTEKLTYEMFHLFGDPEMWIWTEEPKKLEVTHPSKIGSEGLQEFVVKVTDENGNPVHNAAVCLRKSNDIHVAKYTNPNGTVFFEIEPSTGGNMDITVTAHNYRPYEGIIEVTYNGANISLSPNIGPEGAHFTIYGNNFWDGEDVSIYFGDEYLGTVTATGGSFSENFTVPDVPEGPTNVVAIGKTSSRAAVALFRVLHQPLPDPYTYCQWDPSTWHLANGEKKWDSPSIQLYEDGTEVESKDLVIGVTYTIKAKIYNSGIVPADETKVTFKWAQYGAGQKVWNVIGTKTVDVPPAPGFAEASVEWTPITTGHVCIRVEIYHPWDSNLDNNKGQENTHVAPVSSPGEVEFIVENPTNKTGLVYLELTQTGREKGEPLWGTKIERKYPQILKPGGSQKVKVRIYAPDNARIGDSRTFSIDAILDGEVIGGIEFDAVVDHPPILEPYVPQSGVVGEPVTFTVKYVDEDNHPPTEGYPKLSILKDGVPVEGNPFTMREKDPTDKNYRDGKFYTYSVSFSEPGEYIYFIYAYDSFTCSKVNGTIVMVMPAQPSVSISTDKYEYRAGDVMLINITITNPSERKGVKFLWTLDIDYDKHFTIINNRSLMLPPHYDKTFTLRLKLPKLKSSFNASWHVAIFNATTSELISEDLADWKYAAEKAKKSEDMKELEKSVREIIPF